ncbi:MAG TPA: DNA polymerase III subunit delta, partial [Anaerolineae bacterium]|nr:DNA polymerase III subunit delta [Anaerolineae bacterium]
KDFLNGLIDYVPHLLETTRLVFVEFQSLNPKHQLIKLAEQQKGKTVIECKQPAVGELPHWIIDCTKRHSGSIESGAAQRLAALIGGDLRRLDVEINKLITYVNAQRAITAKDVDLLVSDASTSNVFDLVDALGKRDGKRAIHELHHLLDQGENPLGLLAMIVRQYRLLILVKELQTRSLSPDAIAKELGQHPFVIKKLSEQARNYRDITQLETIYRRLLDIETEIKTGQTSDVLALDLLVAGIAG